MVWSAAGSEIRCWSAKEHKPLGDPIMLEPEGSRPVHVHCLVMVGSNVWCGTGKSIVVLDTESGWVTGWFPPPSQSVTVSSCLVDPGSKAADAEQAVSRSVSPRRDGYSSWVLVDEGRSTPPVSHIDLDRFGGAMSPQRSPPRSRPSQHRPVGPNVKSHSLLPTPNGEVWCTTQLDGTVQIFDSTTGEKRREWIVDCGGINTLLLDNNGMYHFYDVRTTRLSPLLCVSFSSCF